MLDNRKGLGVGGKDDELGDSAVEGLGGLVGTLLQLAVVGGLLDDVEDLLGEGGVGDWPRGSRVLLVRHVDGLESGFGFDE